MGLSDHAMEEGTFMAVNRRLVTSDPWSSDAGPGVRPFIATSEDRTVSFQLAADAEAQRAVFRMRERAFRGSQDYLLGLGGHRDVAADRRDLSSYIFSCRVGDTVVASCRFVTRGEAEYPLAQLVPPDLAGELGSEQFLEASRAVVAPALRGRQLFEVMLYFSCFWLLRNTSYQSYGSVCVPALARFYQACGIHPISPDPVTVPGREQNRYLVIHARLRRSLDLLSESLPRRGWSLSHTPAELGDTPRAVATPVCEDIFRLSGMDPVSSAFAFLVARSRRVLYLSHVGVWSAALDERATEILGGRPVDDIILARVSPGERASVQRLALARPGSRIHVPAPVPAMSTLENVRPVHRSAGPSPVPGVPELATCVQGALAGEAILLYDARWRGLFGLEATLERSLEAVARDAEVPGSSSSTVTPCQLAMLPRDTKIIGPGTWSTYPTLDAVLGHALPAT